MAMHNNISSLHQYKLPSTKPESGTFQTNPYAKYKCTSYISSKKLLLQNTQIAN